MSGSVAISSNLAPLVADLVVVDPTIGGSMASFNNSNKNNNTSNNMHTEDAVDQIDHLAALNDHNASSLTLSSSKRNGNQHHHSQQDPDFVDFKASAESMKIPKETRDGNLVLEHGVTDVTTITTATTTTTTPSQVAESLVNAASQGATFTDRQDGTVDNIAVDSASNLGVLASSVLSNNNRDRFVTPRDFDLLKVIGMGAFGKVLQVRNKHSREILAMKIISKRLLRRKSGYIENVLAEREILTRVRHPFVVTMHCSFQTREKLFIIMDFLAGGELFLRIGKEGLFLEKTAAFYLAEIILALDHLHSLGILHRDLKPENILLSSDGHICLTDFGLAKDFSNDGGFHSEEDETRASTICGTQEYMAPEMIARTGYGRAADYWSMGCIAYEMLSGLPPFQNTKGAKDLFRRIMTERVKMPDGSSASACKLLKGLLNRNAQARLGTARNTMFEIGGVAGLKKADFFSHINWDQLERKEVDPPAVLSVQSEEDLRWFHDEFTGMNLPRSVMEMSKDNFRPHRVESHAFRGFSFIHDDFLLPERDEEELKSYWESVEEDGESVSECASSKFDVTDQEHYPEPITDKKKRPPRKRKKKAGAVDTAPHTLIPTPHGLARSVSTNCDADGVELGEGGSSAANGNGACIVHKTTTTESAAVVPVIDATPTESTHPDTVQPAILSVKEIKTEPTTTARVLKRESAQPTRGMIRPGAVPAPSLPGISRPAAAQPKKKDSDQPKKDEWVSASTTRKTQSTQQHTTGIGKTPPTQSIPGLGGVAGKTSKQLASSTAIRQAPVHHGLVRQNAVNATPLSRQQTVPRRQDTPRASPARHPAPSAGWNSSVRIAPPQSYPPAASTPTSTITRQSQGWAARVADGRRVPIQVATTTAAITAPRPQQPQQLPLPHDEDTIASSDWRQHSMSPRSLRKTRETLQHHAPAASGVGGATTVTQWPTLDLGKDPPLVSPSQKSNSASNAGSKTVVTKKLQGAWATRSGAAK